MGYMSMVGEPSVQSAAYAELLVESGLVTQEQLAIARAAKAKTGSHIDEILVGMGMVDPVVLLRVMARSWNLPSLDLASTRIDEDLVRQWSGQLYLAENWMPLRDEPDGRILVATARIPDADRAAQVSAVLGVPVQFVVATSGDIRSAVLRVFHATVADEAANELWRANPGLSARVVLSRAQRVDLIVLAVVLVVLGFIAPRGLAIGVLAVASIVFLLSTVFRFVLAIRGTRPVEPVAPKQLAALQDQDLPVYTVLAPVFREADLVSRLIGNLVSIDYPIEKLEVLLLVEEDDDETRDAIQAVGPPPNFHIITVPKGEPQTKPRACNIGLFFASGEYLVIYDVGDIPDPDQLKKAVIAFRNAGESTTCVRAPLSYVNADANLLTRMIALENSSRFDYPLSGTSNHFRTAALVELGGWDSYNVTDDADLGIRANAMGHRVGVIDSTTMAEASSSVSSFIGQRGRWMRGNLQTALVHARRPIALIRQVGLGRFLGFSLLTAGTPATFLGVIPFLLLALVTLLTPSQWLNQFVPVWVLWSCLASFVIGNALGIGLSIIGSFRQGRSTLFSWALLTPAYWVLNSVAAYRGLWELVARPRRHLLPH